MAKRNMFVGMDVHKESIDVSMAEEGRDGEVRHYGVISSDLEPLDKRSRWLVPGIAGAAGAVTPTPLSRPRAAPARLVIPILATAALLALAPWVMPLFMLPGVTFQPGRLPYAPTMEGQYIIKNLLIISAALVVGATVRRRTETVA